MPASAILFGFPAVVSWSIGPLSIRGGDVYAVVGLIAVFVLLSLWVVVGHLLRTRGGGGESSESLAPEDTATPRADSERHIGSVGSEATMMPVRARPEWLLDDNTLVRTRAVRRGPVRRTAPQAPEMAADITSATPGEASGDENMPPARP